MGLTNVERHEVVIEVLPLVDESVDIVISNGVHRSARQGSGVAEIDRVLRPGGILQIADVFRYQVSRDARKGIDLWTG